MKGISTVIATLLMLVITIALAAMAYTYISGVFTTQAQGIDVLDSYCNGTHVFITIRNIGTVDIPANGIVCTQTAPSGDTCVISNPAIPPGTTHTLVDACSGTLARSCIYRIRSTTGGRSLQVAVSCY